MNTGQYEARETAVIEAPPDVVYAIIADYHEGHPAILPPRYFTGLSVTKGGYGTGTAVETRMNVFGTKVTYAMVVTEPEPGRMLVETDEAAGVVTRFTVDPLADGRRSRVTIATTARTAPGVRGFLEKLLNPAIIRRIYREQLARLAQVANTNLG